ncbi:pentapeptide repeat-containing protein [cf. Phormidesmis sp. LEGE 11477]|uniref:pentapeptide repeat-containing protein n=1 Tax=cf. Phormidesmis sp. LEGE 11477 TaxID=1828680 RepID=UPI001880B4F1|nr:pentapeptide repeat-containing protein [cf. Phormidesmis sp. LEGE 11477]MBE9060075.1 pentapeptide repeat-containing protein [cf. Phormidesmis sp. LEGE 11477]
MEENFAGQILKGRSFKHQNLTGANFREAQIQGANFTGAVLTGADFSAAKAGVGSGRIASVLVLVGLSGFLLGLFGTAVSDTVNTIYLRFFGPLDGIIAFSTVGFFSFLLLRWDLTVAIWGTVLGGLINWIVLFCWEYFHSFDFLDALLSSESVTGGVIITIIAFWIGASVIISTSALLLSIAHFRFNLRARFGSLEYSVAIFAALTALPGTIEHAGWLAKINAPLDTGLLFWLCLHTTRRILTDHPRYSWLRRPALAIASIGSTCFRRADLSEANFSGARLNAVDFVGANLARTRFQDAQSLDYGRVGQTLLRQAAVRSLVTSLEGQGKSYAGCNLRGACLQGANLRAADFTGADLSDADLTGADLSAANFTRSQLSGACLRGVRLTSSCVESWNIDTATQLEGVECDYIYLLSDQRERRPSHGNFQLGDFTKLFQDVLHTVDLIFRQGLDMSAFMAAFQQVRSTGEAMSVRSIENKGDGVVVVRVEVPESADKNQVQASLNQEYDRALQQLEARYQAELAAKDAQIDLYKQHRSELSQLTQLLTQQVPRHLSMEGKRIVIKIAQQEEKGLPATMQIGDEGIAAQLEQSAWLPAADRLLESNEQWQRAYRQVADRLSQNFRISALPEQITNVSYLECFERCLALEKELSKGVNDWLSSDSFRPIREALMMSLKPEDSIRFFLQTNDLRLRALPLHLWMWFDHYRQAELVLSEPSYRRLALTDVAANREGGGSADDTARQVRVLAIFGDGRGLDIERDRRLLEQLADVALTCLVEPERSHLNDTLWSQPWDILFFAGHSASTNGQQSLRLSPTESLTLSELKYALRKATERGLKLSILNACDGLQLIQDLQDHGNLPPTIVMRYPVPDAVAQAFLKHFLTAFSQGIPLHQSVRDAREQLQGIESRFPFASWLPVLHQNPATLPLTWPMLKN